MPESKMDPNAPRVGLGEALASRRSKINQEPAQAPTPSQYDQMWAALKQNLDLKNMAIVTGLSDGGLGGKQAPVLDTVDQLAKLNQSLGVNVADMMKEQRQAAIDANAAKTAAEKQLADMKFELLGRAIAEIRTESQKSIDRIAEILTKKEQQPGQANLFGLADQATNGKYTQQFLDRAFAQQQPMATPVDSVKGVLQQAAEIRALLGLDQKPVPEPIPLEKDIRYHELILNNDRLTKLDQQKLEIEAKRAESINTFAQSVTQGISDLAAALMAKYSGGKKEQAPSAKREAPTQPQATAVEYIPINCPNPACGKSIPWLKNAPAGSVGECPYCHVAFSKDDEEEKTA